MNKFFQCYLLVGLVLTVDFAAAGQSTQDGQREPTLTVNLHVIDYAEVPENTLIRAEQEVTNIFHKIGVDIVWGHVPVPSEKKRPNSTSTQPVSSTGPQVRISIYPRSMAKPLEDRLGDMDHVFGFAPRTETQAGRWIYIFYHRVEELVQQRRLQEHKARNLGLAMAHELGHLLLPFHSHSRTGIMRARWNRQDFQLAALGNLGFTTQQTELIRNELSQRMMDQKAIINLYVYNYARVPEGTLREAENQVAKIFRNIGVETRLLQFPVFSEKEQLKFANRQPQESAGLDLRISILPRLRAKPLVEELGLNDRIFGVSLRTEDQPGQLAYVFYHHVSDFAQQLDLIQHKARILGLAIAHEMGHLLLPHNSHSSTGIMRATWDREDLRRGANGNLLFTQKEAELIRSGLIRRVKEQQGVQTP